MKSITTIHISVSSPRSFDEVIEALEALLGGTPSPEQWDARFHELSDANASWDEVIQAVETFVGPSGFMCMLKIDIGSLLSLQGRKKQSIRYIIGNPLIANQMIEPNSETGLYVPLSVLVYQDEGEPVTIAYDQPSALMGRFGNRAIIGIAQMLDAKLAELVSHVTQDSH